MYYTCNLCKYTTTSQFHFDAHHLGILHRLNEAEAALAAKSAQVGALVEALAQICANPVIQDDIETDPILGCLIQDARAVLAANAPRPE